MTQVRPAANHADKNLALRGFSPNRDPDLRRGLVDYGCDDPVQPPQLAALFSPARLPAFIGYYRVNDWTWARSPDPGSRGASLANPPVTALGLQTTPGERLLVPISGYDIGEGQEVIILYADAHAVTLHYGRADSAGDGATPSTCGASAPTPACSSSTRETDSPAGGRYRYVPPQDRPHAYLLPALPAGHPIGTASGAELVVAVVDTGSFMDPRSAAEWWQVRSGSAIRRTVAW